MDFANIYNPNEQIEENDRPGRLGVGTHRVMIEIALWRESKSNPMNMLLEVEFVGTGNSQGSARTWINLGHDKEQTRDIARREFHRLCQAVKLTKPIENEEDFHAVLRWMVGKIMMIEIAPDKKDPSQTRVIRFAEDGALADTGKISTDDIPF